MADPMTNVEIEDVLSSIRRLVADGGAAAPVVPRVPKLVLTPAQRIDTVEDALSPLLLQVPVAAPVIATDATAGDPDAPTVVADRLRLMATIAELEAAVRAQGDEFEPDGTGTQIDLDWARAGVTAQDGSADMLASPVTAPMDAAAWPATLTEAARRYGDAADAAGSDAAKDADEPTFRHLRMPPPASTLRHRALSGRHPQPAALPNAASSGDGAGADDPAAWQDDLIGGPDLGPDPEDEMHRYLSGAALTDPDALRAMVTQIVREELQGQLGVKITRNVRKLVRSEIHRILTTESFDEGSA
ncbi:hypothetical protein SAMN04488003_11735 [Loktanella fryxellensis]|uniref:Uncharacterized protein n=1 Tax=Loktanella fryxellensis TaxID=245187 RepID=A0A1H8GPU8_9RHOB|nr:hypothetical protein [Loktanella fryxellensis]SEN45839.1 hypothetical protein SAMN04488003_11735 [Loktanella fryxellensis]